MNWYKVINKVSIRFLILLLIGVSIAGLFIGLALNIIGLLIICGTILSILLFTSFEWLDW